MDYEKAKREHIAAYVRHLLSRPGREGSKVMSLDSGGGLANATLQQRITGVRLFYDFLVEEEQCLLNPARNGRYTPGKGFGGARDRGLIPQSKKLPWILDDRDWSALLEVTRRQPLRTKVMFSLSYDAALKREKLCSLEAGDIDPSQRLTYLPQQKALDVYGITVHTEIMKG